MEKFDAIIIGAGQAGNPLAKRLSREGWRVALIESAFVGGTCINYGCTPTKTLVGSAKHLYQARRAADYGIKIMDVEANYAVINQRKNRIVADFRGHLEKSLMHDPNIRFIHGEAVFSGHKELRVRLENRSHLFITAEYIFINSGSRPLIADIKGLESVQYFTSQTILGLEVLPQHLMIIGGGYVALEFAQVFRRMGSTVTVVERSPHLLQNEDEDVSVALRMALEREGVQVIADTFIKRVSAASGGFVNIEMITAGKPLHLSGTHLLIATGRTANTENLDLFKTGIRTDPDGYITVNDQLQTTVAGIYAVGDVKGGPAFTHVSYHDYIVLADNILGSGQSSIRNRLIPYCIFTDPELGRIGFTEKAAREKGLQFSVAKMEANFIARAVETGETTGFLKALVDNHTRKILGAAILCAGGGELMSLLQVAMHGGLTCDQLRDTMFAHPTYAEAINNLFSPAHLHSVT